MMQGHGTLGRTAICLLCLLAGLWGAFSARAESLPPDIAAQIPAPVTPPNRFGLSGDHSWFEVGQKTVPVKPRKRVVEISKPGVLDQADTEYRLMNDVAADGTAFLIKNHNITLNLNGHTVVYGKNPEGDENYGVHIGLWNFKDVAVLNGNIVQAEPYAPGGRGKRWETPYGTGSCAIWGRAVWGGEFAGLYIRYGGDDASGINLWGHSHHIHHNTIEDVGVVVSDRHKGLAAIEGSAYPSRHVHNNLILRARHNGIRGGKGGRVHHNVVHIDSVETNSTGIASGGEVFNNKVVGVGTHPIGFYIASDLVAEPMALHGNYVEVQNTRASREYGSAGAVGIRYQTGGEVEARDNTIILRADADYQGSGFNSWGRAIWASITSPDGKALFENNLVVALARDGKGKAAGLAVVASNVSPNLVFRGNTVVSTWADVLLADSYGHAGGFARFEDNTFMRAVHAPEFVTIRSQYSGRPSTGVFVGTRFAGGASFEDVDLEFGGTGLKEIAIAARLEVAVAGEDGRPIAQAAVSIADAEGVEVFSGTTDDTGRVVAEIVQYRLTNRDKGKVNRMVGRLSGRDSWLSPHTPHEVTASSNGRAARARVDVGGDSQLDLTLR